jgi:hypothetical protein
MKPEFANPAGPGWGKFRLPVIPLCGQYSLGGTIPRIQRNQLLDCIESDELENHLI